MATILPGIGARVQARNGSVSVGPLFELPGFEHTAAQHAQALMPFTAYSRTAAKEVPAGVAEAHDHWELPVDLEWVATVLEGDPIRSHGAFLDLLTGEVIPAFTTDVERAGEEAGPNPAAEPERWLFVPSLGSRAARQDMAEFAAMITYRPLRKRMEIAIEGLGAFHRFRDLIYSEGLVADWHAFSDSRRLARAREFLADLGVRVSAS
jgi:hypothetical protein